MRTVRTVILGAVAVYCVVVSVIRPGVLALQRKELPDFGTVEHRLKVLEEVKPEHRLTHLETEYDDLALQLHGAVVGVATLLVEAAVRIGKRRPRGGD